MIAMFIILILMIVSLVFSHIKINKLYSLNMQLIIGQLHLNKGVKFFNYT